MEAKPTPGPWFTKREGFSTVYVEARIGGGLLQEVAACGPTQAGSDQQEANARLIAAAPELLEALEDAINRIKSSLKLLNCDDEFIDREIEKARAAIAKATT